MREIAVAIRQFRKKPTFAITVILTIALGIGANTAIFTLVHAVLMRSLPVKNPHALYRIGDQNGQDGEAQGFPSAGNDGDFSMFSYALYRHVIQPMPQFSDMAAMETVDEHMAVRSGHQAPQSERTEFVSGNYFQTLGIGPFTGRTLLPSDDTPQAAPVAVMSYVAWQSNYGASPDIVGKTLVFNGHPLTIVGIAPAGFFGDRIDPQPPAFWIPLSDEPMLHGNLSVLHLKDLNWLYLLGRLKPGANPKEVAAEITARLRAWLRTVPAYTDAADAPLIPRQYVHLTPGGQGIQNLQEQERQGLLLLMSICLLVLFVACANVANLLLARGTTQRADVSLQVALGAARSRIIRQMLVESLLLAFFGGIAGLGVAYAGAQIILALAFPGADQLPIHPHPSPIVLGFAFLLSMLTGLVFGIVPAWITSHAEPAEVLRGINRSTRDRSSLPQRWLIIFQAALSLILLFSAGLLTRSLAHLEHQNLGIQTANRYIVHIDPASAGYTAATALAFNQELEQRFGALPGIESVGLALYTPLEHQAWMKGVYLDGHAPPPQGHFNVALFDRISPGFFAAIGQPLIRGRGFADSDTQSAQGVVIVNQAFVRRYYPHQNPIGQYFGSEGPQHASAFRIIGVVGDTKYINPSRTSMPMFFRPTSQEMTGLTDSDQKNNEDQSMLMGAIVLHFRTPPRDLTALVRQTLASINPNLMVVNIHAFRYQVSGNFNQDRLLSRLSMLFGLLALLLASVGIYGVASYQVSRRVAEIGVRMALGATRGSVIRMVLRAALIQIIVGLIIGIPLALVISHLMAHQLFNVPAYDPLSLLIAVAALLLAAALAALLPARRAARIDPMIALRSE